MAGTELRLGTLVEHPARPEWGPGRVVRVHGDRVEVFFRDHEDSAAKKFPAELLRVCAVQADPVLDNLPELVECGGKLALTRDRITVAQAKQQFLRRFPEGFQDPAFIGTPKEGERTYKWLAHERYGEHFSGGRGRGLLARGAMDKLVGLLGKVMGGASNLMALTEQIAFKQGLGDPVSAEAYFRTLFDLVEGGPSEGSFTKHAQAVASLPASGATHTDKWTIVTVLPFLARPDTFMFVKPGNINKASTALAFDVRYDPSPNWPTYERVLRLAQVYREQLADLGARDFIDVQSFFWVTGDTYEAVRAAGERRRNS